MSEWLRVAEAAKYLKVTPTTIYRWCASGVLPYHKLKTGGGRRFLLEDLDKLLLKPGESPEP